MKKKEEIRHLRYSPLFCRKDTKGGIKDIGRTKRVMTPMR